jgi:N-acetylmuramoyl-L-alanine amidase
MPLALPTRLTLALAILATATLHAQNFNRSLIVLDPAHGGNDIGARISDRVVEKDVTLALAIRLRSLLAARGFTVVLTRTTDADLTPDQRAELANRNHAVACLVLHATASGTGVHLATSTLTPILTTQPAAPIPWDDAQATYLPQSQHLAAGIAAALTRSTVPLLTQHAALRPLDNLLCPAVSIELAPLVNPSSDPTPITDAGYQQRVSEAIAGALIFWRNQAQPPVYAPGSPSENARPAGNSPPQPGQTGPTP